MPEHLLFADSLLDNSLRTRHNRGLSAVASFSMQALALALLVLAPLLYTQKIPALHLTGRELVAPAPLPPEPVPQRQHLASSSTVSALALRPIDFNPRHLPTPESTDEIALPTLPLGLVDPQGVDHRMPGVFDGPGTGAAPYIPPKPSTPPPARVSRMMEGNLIQRIQPPYPSLARQARIQGAVVLRAVISRTGTIENLQVVSGHPMLAPAAVNAVRQWRYRPYMLNGDPVEVETQVTVNFLLSQP